MPLVSRDKFKRALRITGNADDTLIDEALDDASSAVRDYAGRAFGSVSAPGDRTFYYDGSGVLDIDDASAVTVVRWANAATSLSTDVWEARSELPADIYTYLELPPGWAGAVNPAMGFEYNLDNYARPGTLEVPVVVTAAYGWNTVPGAVQRATMFTAAAMMAFPPVAGQTGGATLASESIADLARSYVIEQGLTQASEGLPARASTLLDPYRRHTI